MSTLSQMQRLDAEHHLHPFTNHEELHMAGTHIIGEGSGVWLRDQKGRRLLDALAGLWCVNVGYGRRELVDAATEQMQRLCYYPSFFNSTTEPAIELATKLSELAAAVAEHRVVQPCGRECGELCGEFDGGLGRAVEK